MLIRKKHCSLGAQNMCIQIYLDNGTHCVVKIGQNVNVGSLTPVLNQKLLLCMDVETHRLYLKEHGRGGLGGRCCSPRP